MPAAAHAVVLEDHLVQFDLVHCRTHAHTRPGAGAAAGAVVVVVVVGRLEPPKGFAQPRALRVQAAEAKGQQR